MIPQDLKVLSRKMRITPHQAEVLCEEEKDLDLVLSQIADKFSELELKKLSFPILTKILVFKFSKEKTFSFQEKAYITNTIIKFLPKVTQSIGQFPVANYKYKENLSQCNLLAFSILNKDSCSIHLTTTKLGFDKNGKADLGAHFDEWIPILKNVGNVLKECNAV